MAEYRGQEEKLILFIQGMTHIMTNCMTHIMTNFMTHTFSSTFNQFDQEQIPELLRMPIHELCLSSKV